MFSGGAVAGGVILAGEGIAFADLRGWVVIVEGADDGTVVF